MTFITILSRLTMARALALGVGLAVIYYFAMFDDGSSQRAAIAQAQQQLATTQKQIEDSTRKLEQAAAYKKTAVEVGGTITKLLSLIPEKFSMSDLMRLISNEAKVAGSSLANLNPRTTEISKMAREFEELSISLELNGTFQQHMTFLSNLTKINQILVVRKFSLGVTKEGHGEDPTLSRMTADIVAYRYRGIAAAEEKGKPK